MLGGAAKGRPTAGGRLGFRARWHGGEEGIVAVNITLFVALALTAVTLLIATTISATDISSQVKSAIQPPISQINTEIALLPILTNVDNSAAQIANDLPMVPQILTGVVNDTNSINSQVVSIHGLVTNIHGTVGAIENNVTGIGNDVSSIGNSVNSIHNSFVAINNDVSGDGASAILQGVAQINHEVDTVIAPVIQIKHNTDTINADVVQINSNANGIDCATLIMGADCGGSASAGGSSSSTGGGGLLGGLGL